jgi:hypothetical protein
MQPLTVPQLQAIVRDNVLPCEDRRVRKHLEAAVLAWQTKQAQLTEAVSEVKSAIVSTESEAIQPALTAALTVEVVAVKAFQAITSPEACTVYRGVLQAVCLAVVFMGLLAQKIALWCWDHRTETALYCWIEAVKDSLWFQELLTRGSIAEWVVARNLEDVLRKISGEGAIRE